MPMILLQAGDALSFPWTQYVNAGSSVLLVAIALYCLLKALPTWKSVKDGDKEVRLAEIAVREKEAEGRIAQSTSFGQLSQALTSMSDVLNNVAIEHKHATENIRILQRVNSDTSERTEDVVNQILLKVDDIAGRVAVLESHRTQAPTRGKRHGTEPKASPTD